MGNLQDVLALDAGFDDLPAMEFSDQEMWQQAVSACTGPTGRRIIAFAERWARSMQAMIDAGRRLEDVVDAAARKADVDDINGYMYNVALSLLIDSWRDRDQLRRWCSKRCSIVP